MKFSTVPTHPFAAGASSSNLPQIMAFPMRGTWAGQGGEFSPSPLTPFPVGMTLAQAVEFYWRVKQFEVTFACDFFTGAPRTFFIDRVNNTDHDDEKQLLFNSNPFFPDPVRQCEWVGNLNEDEGMQERRISVSLRMFWPAGTVPQQQSGLLPEDINNTPYHLQNDASDIAIICPAMELQVSVFWDRSSEYGGYGTSAYDWDEGTAFAKVINVPIGLADSSQNIGVDVKYGNNFLEDQGEAMELTPTLWFPWADANGQNPTWDAETGARV